MEGVGIEDEFMFALILFQLVVGCDEDAFVFEDDGEGLLGLIAEMERGDSDFEILHF